MSPTRVNDVHSRLNETPVAGIFYPASTEEVAALVRQARSSSATIAVCGCRHAMGGQQFKRDGWLLDTSRLKRIERIDSGAGTVRVESGVTWPELISHYLDYQSAWGIRQKQTGADLLSIGGAVSANAHGRGLRMKPIVDDVEAIVLVDAEGEIRHCSREENQELFRYAIGGYGLFGIITEVTLRLSPRFPIQRSVRVMSVAEFIKAIRENDWIYGDLQFNIDETSPEFLLLGICSAYQRVETLPPEGETKRRLTTDLWNRLLLLAHTDRATGFREYADFYLKTSGQCYWSDTHQLSLYSGDYHGEIDRITGAACPGSEMITELYVPVERLEEFLKRGADYLRKQKMPVIYGTIRMIVRDGETALPWARESWACVIFNLHVDHCGAGINLARETFCGLIDLATLFGGSFFLTYHRWASNEHVLACYPGFSSFLAKKRELDPAGVFRSDWFETYSGAQNTLP